MIIEQELIQEAKEILGNRNAEIMAELLELENYDEKNMKALCPYHKEDTPSFIYDKKHYVWHCFGCNKSVDIVDVLMEQGYSFIQAVQKLFEYADVKYSFGEVNVKTKHKYKYPKEVECFDKTKVYTYLKTRGLSEDTIDYLDIRQDEYGNCVFNFYDTNDVLTMVKYRPSRKIDKSNKHDIKTWCQKDADTTPLLWNMNRINPLQPLVITEGELDTATIVECGFYNVVSVPLGAGNTHWIEENWEWLEQFKSIILCFDNDSAGEKARKDVIPRLGTWRTKYIQIPSMCKWNDKDIPTKDINEVFICEGKEKVLELIDEAKDVPVNSVVDFSDIEELSLADMEGVEIGIKEIDDELIKLYYGTLTILSGRPSSGKTSIIDQAIGNTMDSDNPVWLFSKEMPERMSANWFNSIIAGNRNMIEVNPPSGKKFKVVSTDVKNKIKEYYKGKLFIYKDDEPNDVESIFKSMEACVRKYGVKLLVIDNLMMVDLCCSDENKNEAQTNFVNRLIRFASKFNVAVVLVAHPKKTPDMSSDINMYDIAGSSNIINLAMRSIGMRRVSKKEKEDPKCPFRNFDVVFTIMKDRLLGKNDVQKYLHYDIDSRRFFTSYEEFDKQYKWDTNTYIDKIPYPVKEIEETPF